MPYAFSILGRGRAGRALAAAWGDRVQLLPHSADPDGLVLLAVPDAHVAELARRFPGRAVSLSGSLHLEALPSAHPLASFNGVEDNWNGAPLAITGEVPQIILDAFVEIGFAPFDLPAHLKALYHACAVLSSGHAATLWLGAEALLRDAGVRLPGRGLRALAEGTLRNVEARGDAGRTGPFVRGDQATIARDADALPEPWRSIFLSLGAAPLRGSRT